MIAIVAVLGFTIAVDQTSVSAQERTLRQLDTALATLENDFVANQTRIDSLEDSNRDFNPVMTDFMLEASIPQASNPIKDSEVIPIGLQCPSGEFLTGFSWEVDKNDAKQIHMRTLSMSSIGFNIEFVNTGINDVFIETLIECAVIDVVP